MNVDVGLAHRDEQVDVVNRRANQVERLRVRHGSGSCSRNRSSPCSVQTTGALSVVAKRPGQADEQRKRQADRVEPRLRPAATAASSSLPCAGARAGPCSIDTVMLAERVRIDLDLSLRGQLQHRIRVPDPVEERRRVAEQRQVLFEKHAHAAEEHVRRADILLVGRRRRVDRARAARRGRGRAAPPPARCRAGSCRSTSPRRRPSDTAARI